MIGPGQSKHRRRRDLELLSFLETWYLEDGPLVDEAVDRLQSSVEEDLRRTGRAWFQPPMGSSRAMGIPRTDQTFLRM